MTFYDIAKPMAERGEPQIRIRPNSKIALDKDWPNLATTDLNILAKWSEEAPNCGAGSVAKPELNGVWFFEVDSKEALERLDFETGKLSELISSTLMVRSRPGRGHFHFLQTSESLAMGNLSQAYVKGGDWSARVSNAYVLSPGTLHPESGKPYEIVADRPLAPAPNWLIAWLLSQKIEKKTPEAAELPKNQDGKILHGHLHGWLLSQAGRLRNIGLSLDVLEPALIKLAEEHCAPPIDFDKVKQIARSVCQYPVGQNTALIITPSSPIVQVQPEPEELPTFEDTPYPKFPSDVMLGTSVYENFVKPICDKNSRIPYFSWLPAMQILLNYVATKIKIKGPFGSRPVKGGLYSVIIGRKGCIKSSSVEDAMAYFNYCGILRHSSRDLKNAEGRSIVWTAGSPEGLGLGMQQGNVKNAILYYDELSKLTNKAGIDSSALVSDLLTMYESGKFDNTTKASKNTFNHEPDSYCTSLIACTTDKKFAELWSKLAGSDTGLDDRFTFILQPEPLPAMLDRTEVNTVMGSIETKKRIDAAVLQGEFEFEDRTLLQRLVQIENRYAGRAEKWALAIAIDLGLSEVDNDSLERAVRIVEYEIAVKKYLKSYEATTREGQIQQDVRRALELAKGSMLKRDLTRKIHSDRLGTTLWNQAYEGLKRHHIIREIGGNGKTDPVTVQLLVKRDTDDE